MRAIEANALSPFNSVVRQSHIYQRIAAPFDDLTRTSSCRSSTRSVTVDHHCLHQSLFLHAAACVKTALAWFVLTFYRVEYSAMSLQCLWYFCRWSSLQPTQYSPVASDLQCLKFSSISTFGLNLENGCMVTCRTNMSCLHAYRPRIYL